MESSIPQAVATAINDVMSKVKYVQKKGENTFHKYKFAAVGDVLAEIQPAMAEAGLVIVQDEIAHELIADGAVMTATYAFRLMHKSGAEWDGQARHTGMAAAKNSKGGFDDKALNKCHTAARKYFLMALFQVPTGDAADPDQDEAPAPTSANPTPNDEKRKDEALRWAETHGKRIAAMTRLSDVMAWETKHAGLLDDLRDLLPDTWKSLKRTLTTKTQELESAQKEAA